ncbi:MFS domain-containing protein [Favolaschia claudopus]|uniref:MFS domain-containing protein n=1 Tax=Favolaschia claudopus TaxID=2862362 RepID=A0AAW0E0D8_9AGAR
MLAEPSVLEPVEVEPTPTLVSEESAAEKTAKIGQSPPEKGQDVDVSTTDEDIWSAEFPDGGARAWLVVFGVGFFFLTSRSWFELLTLIQGACTTFSTTLYASSQHWSAAISSIEVNFASLESKRVPFITASAIVVLATFLVAQCTKYWHFVLCQGIVTGMAAGVAYGPMVAVVGHWFQKRRGIANGLVATGSSVGGTLFPIIARNLIPRVGFPWTLRIMAFILLVTLTLANICVRRRLPPKHVPGGLLNLAAFKNPAYTLYCISGVVIFLGLYTVLTYIDVSATSVGISPDFSFYLISMANGASLFGRLMAGTVADRIGAVNIILPFSGVAAVMTFVWPLAHSKGAFVAIAIIYGFSSGAFVSSFLLPMFYLGEVADVGRRSGMAQTLTAIGALAGPPISGAINTASGGYHAVGYYAGSVILVAIVLILITRHMVLGKLWGKF